jgi:hypothetical protein
LMTCYLLQIKFKHTGEVCKPRHHIHKGRLLKFN